MARTKGAKNKKPAVGRIYTRSITIAGNVNDIELLRKKAQEAGKSTSRFVIDTILNK